MKITLKTISEESGLSITTVSRALAGYDDVNEETRQKIVSIAERLGYQPNLAARHLRSKHTQTVGMVIPLTSYFSDPFFMELLSGVGRQAAEYGYDLLLSAQQPGEDELNTYRRMVASSRIDGMVVARILKEDPRITFLKEARHPFIVFGRSNANDYPYIDVDGEAGMRAVVQHLTEMGHRRIALILSPRELAFTSARYAGYVQGLRAAGIEPEETYLAEGTLSADSGHAAALRLLDQTTPPTAIAACNDMMAIGAMQAVQSSGLEVGRDIAVTGFDDIPPSAHAHPPLTTVRQPTYLIGRQALDMLIQVIRQEPLDQSHVLLMPELVIRESSGTNRRR
ncbi:MAG: LacI family DNA-binding transcriptional regulator [Chloroflexi bacterium]|nr:LacI family DNA-binding transcriptional regulator [Chloroflexota bacterium]